jgi:hypothetical protein
MSNMPTIVNMEELVVRKLSTYVLVSDSTSPIVVTASHTL